MDRSIAPPITGNALALDTQGLSRLKKAAGAQAGSADQKQAITESARQVEALFVTQLMKSMRATRMESGLLPTQSNALFEDMLEQQRAQAISARGLGLANVVARQLSVMTQPRATPGAPVASGSPASPVQGE